MSAPYKPGPLAEGMARVILEGESYGEPATFQAYDTFPVIPQAHTVFDVPAEQVARWEAARTAFSAMQEEIEALIEARFRRAHDRSTGA